MMRSTNDQGVCVCVYVSINQPIPFELVTESEHEYIRMKLPYNNPRLRSLWDGDEKAMKQYKSNR